MSLPPPPPPPTSGPPPGWYPDPSGQAGTRWWDGARWTEHVSAPPPPAYYGPAAPQVTTQMGTVILAGWWRRFGAYVVDALVVGVPAFIVGLIVGSFSLVASTDVSGQRTNGNGALVAVVLTAVVLNIGYPFLFLRYRGQTLGMMAFGIRTIDRVNGGPLTMPQTWRRVLTFFFLVLFWGEIATIVNFTTAGTTTPTGGVLFDLLSAAALVTTALWPLNNPVNQTLQDKAANTIVIRTN
ncbi:MAG TPA: RDD family protein [Acidimicrobiales bacterium]